MEWVLGEEGCCTAAGRRQVAAANPAVQPHLLPTLPPSLHDNPLFAQQPKPVFQAPSEPGTPTRRPKQLTRRPPGQQRVPGRPSGGRKTSCVARHSVYELCYDIRAPGQKDPHPTTELEPAASCGLVQVPCFHWLRRFETGWKHSCKSRPASGSHEMRQLQGNPSKVWTGSCGGGPWPPGQPVVWALGCGVHACTPRQQAAPPASWPPVSAAPWTGAPSARMHRQAPAQAA